MTLRGLLFRIIYLTLFIWVVGAIVGSFWAALIWVIFPLYLYEVLRPRSPRDAP